MLLSNDTVSLKLSASCFVLSILKLDCFNRDTRHRSHSTSSSGSSSEESDSDSSDSDSDSSASDSNNNTKDKPAKSPVHAPSSSPKVGARNLSYLIKGKLVQLLVTFGGHRT